MERLKVISILILVSFGVFYLTACLIEATFSIAEMVKETRQIVFGLWGAVVVFGTLFYLLDASVNKSQNESEKNQLK